MATTLETIKNAIDSNTIIGNPIKADKSVIVPISKVTIGFGIGGGEYSKNSKKCKDVDNTNFAGGSGGAITISPVAFVVVEKGETRLISMEDNVNLVDNIMTITPKLIDKLQRIIRHDEDKNEIKMEDDIDKLVDEDKKMNEEIGRAHV